MHLHTLVPRLLIVATLFLLTGSPALIASESASIGSYSVRSVETFADTPNENTFVSVYAYKSSATGHVLKISCFFPPNFDATHLKQMRVVEEIKSIQGRNEPSTPAYYCSKIN